MVLIYDCHCSGSKAIYVESSYPEKYNLCEARGDAFRETSKNERRKNAAYSRIYCGESCCWQ